MTEDELKTLYALAKQAAADKDFEGAVELLKKILLIDENYRDASRLLDEFVQFKRRKWYTDPRLWGIAGIMLLVGLGMYLFPKLQGLYNQPPPTPVIIPTGTYTPTFIPSATDTITATAILPPTPTPIPLAWKRIALGLEFPRDSVSAFATDKKDPDVIYAALMNAGVYKTIDGGLSWHPAHQGLANAQVETLLIDSQNPRILYGVALDGTYTTEDGGENWLRVGDETTLLIDPQNNSHLYARDENGIYETTDQGNNWTNIYTLKKDCPDTISSWAIHPEDGNMLFIGGGDTCAGVYQSSDGGRNWTLIGLEDKPNLGPLVIGLDEQGNFSVYVFFDSFQTGMLRLGEETGIYVSYDGGSSWSDSGQWCKILYSDPNNPSTIYCAESTGLSVKRGKGSWQQIPGTQSIRYTAIHSDQPNDTERIIAGTIYVSTAYPYAGIFISTDGGTSWVKRNVGIGSARSELKIDPMDNTRIYLAAYYEDAVHNQCILYSSPDSGKNWSLLRAADWCGPAFDAANAFYLMDWGALQMSSNGGETWLWENLEGNKFEEHWKHILPSYFLGGSESISANPYFEGLVYDIGDAIYVSTGSGWQKSSGSEGLRNARLFYTDQSKMIYAIGRNHQSYSTDNGKTWQSCGEDVTSSRSDTRLTLDLQGTRLYLATPGQGVFVSTDNCQSWQASNDGLSNLFVNTLAIDPNKSEIVYAGTDGGAYISFDGGQTWGQVNDGLLGATVVYSIVVDKDSNVYAATPYGIFKLESK